LDLDLKTIKSKNIWFKGLSPPPLEKKKKARNRRWDEGIKQSSLLFSVSTVGFILPKMMRT